MADDAHTGPDPFDVQTIKHLVRLMSRHDLSEIDLQAGEVRIRLRRGGRVQHAAPPHPAVAAQAAPPHPDVVPAPAEKPAAEKPARKLHEIKSPTVGTFYAQEKPGAPPYVTAGSRVTPSTVVCQIEAMKIFNEITADCTGTIAEVLVHDKEPVDYGTVLFRVALDE